MQNLGIRVLFEGRNLERLLVEGLGVTVGIAFISIIIGSFFGVILGIIRTAKSKSKIVRFLYRFYLETFRIIPVLVWLFIIYFGSSMAFGINLSGKLSSIIVFSLWGIAEMGDIVRGALESLPKHQIESGKAIGLDTIGLYRYVLIPQAVRRILPGAINLVTRMVKTTSLVVLIGVIDVVKIGQQIIELSRLEVPSAAFWIYGVIFVLYFIICYPLSRLSKKLEAKWQN